jgi:hypothetical protein
VVKSKLVAVRIDPAVHEAVVELCLAESRAGRKLTVAMVYEAALIAFLSAAGRQIKRSNL